MSNPARPAPGALLARLEDAPDGAAIVVDFRQATALFSLILARRGDAIFAYENRCPHAGFPLERPDGRVHVQAGGFLVCSAHGASFALESGACAGGPGNGRGLTPIAVRVENGAILMA